MGKWVSLKRFGSRVHGTKVFFLDIYIYIYIIRKRAMICTCAIPYINLYTFTSRSQQKTRLLQTSHGSMPGAPRPCMQQG